MCFSEVSDSLPMWKYYGNHGYCLHFTKELILRLQNPTFFPYYHYVDFGAVIYSDTQKIKELREIVLRNCAEKHYKENICREINRKRFFFKHNGFDYEKGHRILIAIPNEILDSETKHFCPQIKYKTKSDRILPYIELELNVTQDTPLLSGVTIGPLTDNQLARKSLFNLLKDRGYMYAAGNIVPSNVPG